MLAGGNGKTTITLSTTVHTFNTDDSIQIAMWLTNDPGADTYTVETYTLTAIQLTST